MKINPPPPPNVAIWDLSWTLPPGRLSSPSSVCIAAFLRSSSSPLLLYRLQLSRSTSGDLFWGTITIESLVVPVSGGVRGFNNPWHPCRSRTRTGQPLCSIQDLLYQHHGVYVTAGSEGLAWLIRFPGRSPVFVQRLTTSVWETQSDMWLTGRKVLKCCEVQSFRTFDALNNQQGALLPKKRSPFLFETWAQRSEMTRTIANSRRYLVSGPSRCWWEICGTSRPETLRLKTKPHLPPLLQAHQRNLYNLQEQGDARVGHGPGQTQDATAHDGVTQVEDGHPKGGVALVLWRTEDNQQRRGGIINLISLLLKALTYSTSYFFLPECISGRKFWLSASKSGYWL